MAAQFVKILCPIDLDGSATSALELAALIARPSAAQVEVLHVIRLPLPAEGAPVFIEVTREQAALARASIEQLATKHLDGVSCALRVDIGDPANVILTAAKQLPADLVVMATHGRRGVSRFFLGSVAETVMRGVACPVITAKYYPVDRHSVARWMTRHVRTISPSEKLTVARALMQQHKIRSLPVTDQENLVGIVTDRDVRAHLNRLDTIETRGAMSEAVITVTPATSIWDAARLLRERRIGALPVLDKAHLAGIISTTDLLEALVELQ